MHIDEFTFQKALLDEGSQCVDSDIFQKSPVVF